MDSQVPSTSAVAPDPVSGALRHDRHVAGRSARV